MFFLEAPCRLRGRHLIAWTLGAFVVGFLSSTPSEASQRGAEIYRNLCAECHGPQGEGVAGKHDEALYGQRSVESLARLIERTMPEEKPELCVGDDAQTVAEYIFDAFYSPAARARNQPARVDLARLTIRQFRESVADLVAGFAETGDVAPPGGLSAEYFESNGMNKKQRRVWQRVDRAVDFDFGARPPVEGMRSDQFSIAWNGSLLAPATGDYDFRIRTPNGARLYVNADLQAGDSNRRDDSDARRQEPLIDLWVSSGGEVREETARLFLLGGRRYPVRVDYFKFEDRTAAIQFEWRAPHREWCTVSGEFLAPSSSPSVVAISTPFPADDGSLGYERGSSISKAWHEAATHAALEAATEIVARLGRLSDTKVSDSNRVDGLKTFCATFAERAFRRPLGDALRARVVDEPFAAEGIPPETAVQRSLLTIFSSPRFLYPELGGNPDDYTVASRLALSLWDSVPDATLREAAARGELRTESQVREQARRMLSDPRARTKLQGFFEHWLAMKEAEELNKDTREYPGFDATLIADLRASLERFVDDVVWNEGSDYRQLLQADYLFLNPRLAEFYGVPRPAADRDGFARITFDRNQRAGIFTHPYLLAAFSYHRSTSPIHRGVFLTRNVLGRFLKPPPMAIEFMDDRFDPTLTMREKVTELTGKPACMSCHSTINPLGFSLEHYDAVGRYRTTDNQKPVDAESEYTASNGEVIRLRGPRDLAEHAARNDDARRGFVRQLFQHTVKQAPPAYGPATLDRLDADFAASGHHIRHLLVDVAVVAALHEVSSDPTATR